ncbi:MAG: hypothetical protein WCS65_18080 [Verrucomicrobiae bacterium]
MRIKPKTGLFVNDAARPKTGDELIAIGMDIAHRHNAFDSGPRARYFLSVDVRLGEERQRERQPKERFHSGIPPLLIGKFGTGK